MSTDTPKGHIRYFDFVAPAAITLRSAGDFGGFDATAIKRRDELFREYCRETSVWSSAYYLPRQTHKRRVRVLSRGKAPTSLRNTDGLISANAAHSLAITVADCLPIYVAVPTRGIVGLLHSGRKSTGILSRAFVMLYRKYRVPASDIHLLFGPAILSCCYEVNREVAVAYQKRWGRGAMQVRDGAYYLDIVRANERIADAAGVKHVQVTRECTCCDTRYHSYRRQGADPAQRMLALISPPAE